MYKHTYKLAAVGAALALFAGGAFAQAGSSTNMFGGPIYSGAPALNVTAALVEAGGGAENFSFAKALVSMLGEKNVNAEVAKLTKQYGKADVNTFITGMDYAVKDALKRATEQGIKLPPPAKLHGTALASVLVTAGTAPDGVFWSGYLFDHALSHGIHNQVMDDINKNVSTEADMTTHKLLNQAMYDVAHKLGHTHVKLASLH
ncbi:MAG: hypothetical protein ACRETQ_00905 [Gammaproteobacteria bacterium]